jgi:hypothetical protein
MRGAAPKLGEVFDELELLELLELLLLELLELELLELELELELLLDWVWAPSEPPSMKPDTTATTDRPKRRSRLALRELNMRRNLPRPGWNSRANTMLRCL